MPMSATYPQFSILMVDDEVPFLRSMSLTLERHGFTNLLTCHDPRAVQGLMQEHHIGLILLDLTMPVMSGQDVLTWLQEEYPDVAVIIFSGLNQVEAAVDCVKAGAFDYIVKTADQDQIIEAVKRAIHTQELDIENQALRNQLLSKSLNRPECFDAFISRSDDIFAVFRYLESVAQSNQPVLINGESGVGKELIANAVHQLSGRKGEMVSVNVAGLDDNIFADTLFGHARGAFTGADRSRQGLVEAAAGGTLFLDEIGDLSPASQVKLLRLLQEGEYYPIGSDKPKLSRARIVVATHQDLGNRQADGAFRKDLYYRLRTHMVSIPPLRERIGDLPLLVRHFVDQACDELNKDALSIPDNAIAPLIGYPFPGNVRELRAMVFDAVSQSHGDTLAPLMELGGSDGQSLTNTPVSGLAFAADLPLPTLAQANAELVTEAMRRADHNQSLAARMLGISQPALSKRLKNMRESD